MSEIWPYTGDDQQKLSVFDAELSEVNKLDIQIDSLHQNHEELLAQVARGYQAILSPEARKYILPIRTATGRFMKRFIGVSRYLFDTEQPSIAVDDVSSLLATIERRQCAFYTRIMGDFGTVSPRDENYYRQEFHKRMKQKDGTTDKRDLAGLVLSNLMAANARVLVNSADNM